MVETPSNTIRPVGSRATKLEAIASIFGEEIAQKLGAGPPASEGRLTKTDETQRVAWQRNRLIQHVRQRTSNKSADADGNQKTMKAQIDSRLESSSKAQSALIFAKTKPTKLPHLTPGEDLSVEHPAVIAHILRDASQSHRVAVLRSLPGRTARAVMHRLRTM